MIIATSIAVGLLLLIVGSTFSWLTGVYLLALGNELAKPDPDKPAGGLIAGATWVTGIIFLAAGPLASLWLAIFVGTSIAGV